MIGLETQKEQLKAALKTGQHALLSGETGTGKTALAMYICQEMGREYNRVNLDGGITPDQLIGRHQTRDNGRGVMETYFQYGVLVETMRKGAVLILDEVNAALPDTLFCLYNALESGQLYVPETCENITAAKGFVALATMNPGHDYSGTRELSIALKNRFALCIEFATMSEAEIMKALAYHVPEADANHAANLANIINQAALLVAAQKISTRLSIRQGVATLRLIAAGMNFNEAVTATITGRLLADERKELNLTMVNYCDSRSVADVFSAYASVETLQAEKAEMQDRLEKLGALQSALEGLTGSLAKRKKAAV